MGISTDVFLVEFSSNTHIVQLLRELGEEISDFRQLNIAIFLQQSTKIEGHKLIDQFYTVLSVSDFLQFH